MRDPLPKRKQIRLAGYDYSAAGVYFLTICTANREKTLSSICPDADDFAEPLLSLTDTGRIVETYLRRFPGADKYVIMPNHVHLLVIRASDTGREIATDINAFKSLVSKAVGRTVWQRGYYDHVIRNEKDYQNHWQYIEDNPVKWCEDPYFAEE